MEIEAKKEYHELNKDLTHDVRQVIVMRRLFKDVNGNSIKVRRGKEIAQACHASVAWLVDKVKDGVKYTHDELTWMNGAFTKICLQVDTEEELLKVYEDAKAANLTVKLITDSGRTEFNGIPTNTCLAIGPHEKYMIDPVTKHLKLY